MSATESDPTPDWFISTPPRDPGEGRIRVEVAHRASPAPPPKKERNAWQSGKLGRKAVVGIALTWPAAAPLAFALGLFTALPERISYTVGRELMCLKSFSLRRRKGGRRRSAERLGGPNGLELCANKAEINTRKSVEALGGSRRFPHLSFPSNFAP